MLVMLIRSGRLIWYFSRVLGVSRLSVSLLIVTLFRAWSSNVLLSLRFASVGRLVRLMW